MPLENAWDLGRRCKVADKWGKKDVLEYARQLKSPFEEIGKNNGQGLSPAIQRLREIAGKVLPQVRK